jgi:sugar phosphate permease
LDVVSDKRHVVAAIIAKALTVTGIMNMCMGFVNSYAALVGVRVLLGIFEAGLGPGSIYLITMYYRRYELPKRLSWWYCSGIVAGAFGGLLAYAIAHMDGIQGYSGWRWIFIIEGLVTAVAGIVMKWWLVDWPEDSGFLDEQETAVLMARLSADRAEEAKMDKWNTKRVFSDWKILLGYVKRSFHVDIALTI